MGRLRKSWWTGVLVLAGAFVLAPESSTGAQNTYEVSGFVGKSSTEAASRVVVKLIDPESGKALDMTTTGMFGKYKFKDVKPGLYVLQVGDVKREVLVKTKNVRADVDLSAKDGVMRTFTTEKLIEGMGQGGGGSTGGESKGPEAAGPAAGPNDVKLQEAMAGAYWGYQGSTEVKLALCGNGRFYENSESSYSGRGYDGGGNQTMAWGTANQRGNNGRWSAQGSQQQGTLNLVYSGGRAVPVRFRAVDRQCFNFDGRTLCRTGPANCQ